MSTADRAGPVVIGGVGGSGTRVVAQMMLDVGFHMGNDINDTLDDLWFNFLFFRPKWLERKASGERVAIGLQLMQKRAAGQQVLSPLESRFLLGASRDAIRDRHFGRIPAAWVAKRLWRFLRCAPATRSGRYVGWGWKEPISHLVAPDVLARFPTARYIHVMRHGLDMAFSRNLRQVERFGGMFGLPVRDAGGASPQEALRFWIRSNRRIVDGICRTDPERTHLLVFDDLCDSPDREVGRLLEFLGLDVSDAQRRALSALPRTPASVGQYKAHDLAAFDRADLQAVASMGFSV
jgi:Sulfotransferase family